MHTSQTFHACIWNNDIFINYNHQVYKWELNWIKTLYTEVKQ